jgi:hypothetical protein
MKLINLNYSIKSGLYEIAEEGITYGMPIELTRQLTRYFCNNSNNTISDWYYSLDRQTKKQVKRIGFEPTIDESFIPDPSFD